MSSYAEFYIRVDKTFIPMAAFSRNQTIYEEVRDCVPYDKARPISFEFCNTCIMSLERKKAHFKSSIQNVELEMSFMEKCNNSMDEKIEHYAELASEIQEIKDEIEYIDDAIAFFNVVKTMIDEVGAASKYEDIPVNYEKYIYCGIDCGTPTIEDEDEPEDED